jgi:hypothetical protein
VGPTELAAARDNDRYLYEGDDEFVAAAWLLDPDPFPIENAVGVLRRLIGDAGALVMTYNDVRAARKAASAILCDIVRDVSGDPFNLISTDSEWSTSVVGLLAQAVYDERAFDRLPVLADALEEAGCTSADILDHCRSPGPHVRGCWVVDLLLGKE